MNTSAAIAFALLLSAGAGAVAQDRQDDERIKRIVERIEKEIRDAHEKTREEIRAIIRAEIQKSQGKSTPAPAPEAKPSRKVYLGISADDLSEADRKALGSSSGIRVADVRGPAKEAGIQPGDLLVELDGEPVSEDKIGDILSKHQPGDTLPATVLRAKKRVPVKILLAERKD
ncbi:MAG TPA: PDZ domain-containing protein [Planctomycetota bacterium]|nr:PDZ domain-containing protein [Planctomycetota bacterium]